MQSTVWYKPNRAASDILGAGSCCNITRSRYRVGGSTMMLAGAWIWLKRWKRGEVDLN